jgi:flagellar FliL protein
MAEEHTTENSKDDVQGNRRRSRGSIWLIVTIVVIVQIVATLGGFYFFVKPVASEVEFEEVPSDAAEHEEEDEGEDPEDLGIKEGEELLGAIYPLEMFISNLSDGGVIRVEIQLEFTSREIPRRLSSRMPVIRDTILSILAQKSRDALLGSKGREIFKQDVKTLVNQRLMNDVVKSVLFTQYVIQ